MLLAKLKFGENKLSTPFFPTVINFGTFRAFDASSLCVVFEFKSSKSCRTAENRNVIKKC